MANHNCKSTSLKFQSPTENYTRNGRQIASGHDFGTASYFYRIDGGPVREFSSRTAMEKALDVELTPAQNLDLPQLPANIPYRLSEESHKELHRKVAKIRSWGTVLPTRGVIALPASTTPEQPKPAPKAPPLTKAQQKVADDFLAEATEYFTLLSKIDNLKNKRDWHDTKWHLICAFERMSGRAFTYAQLVGLGM